MGQQTSMFGSSMVYFALLWWIVIQTQSPIFLSITLFFYYIAQIGFTPLAGVLADRYNRKSIIIFVDAFQALFAFILFLGFYLSFSIFWLVLSIITLVSVLQAFQTPTYYAIISSMVPKENLSRINGADFFFSGLIRITGPLLGGFLIEFFPITYIFFIDIITFLISIIPTLLVAIPKVKIRKEIGEKESFKREFMEGFKLLRKIPGLLALMFFAMIFNLLYRPFTVLISYFVYSVFNGSAIDLAIITVYLQVGHIIGAIITITRKNWKHKARINLGGIIIFFAFYIPFIISPNNLFLIMSIGILFGGIIFPITVSTYISILQSVSPPDKVGRIISMDHTISIAISPIAAIISGPLAEILGIRNFFFVCAILGMIYPIIFWFFTKIKYLDHQENLDNFSSSKVLI